MRSAEFKVQISYRRQPIPQSELPARAKAGEIRIRGPLAINVFRSHNLVRDESSGEYRKG